MDFPSPPPAGPSTASILRTGPIHSVRGSYHGHPSSSMQSLRANGCLAGHAAPAQVLGSLRIEWCPRRGVAAPRAVKATIADDSAVAEGVSTSGRSRTLQIVRPGGQPMLQLMAAWDSLAARLPPGTSSSASPEVLLQAIKLLLAHASPEDTARGLALASRLAELAGSGLPIDMDSIAAGVLVEAFPRGLPMSHDAVARRLGEPVAALVADLAKISRLPARIDLYDDAAAAALRELCLNFYDVRATAVEVVSRLHALEQGCSSGGSHSADCQVLALEALQLFAPMGHALGMSSVSSRLEDLCFGILFPASYRRTAEWLQHHAAAHRSMLEAAERALHAAVSELPQFAELAAGLEVHGRTKSPISTLKKVLRLGDMTKGGRTLREIYDLVGLRAIIVPRRDLPQAVAEDRALQACYLVESTAHAMWQPVEGRSKDYIASPKANGYQSLHSTIQLDAELLGMAGGEDAPRVRTLELQVRTEAMHRLAESGEAAHAAYKGGLDATQARQLQDWTESLLRRSSLAPAVEVDMDLAAASADEALFRSMDLNGDGAVSLEELHQALAELGVVGHAEADAQALLAAVDTNADGSISLAEFMAFQKRVGLVHAASAMDKATEDVLIDIEAVRQEESVAKEASSDEWSFSAADAVFRSSVPVANTGSGSYSAMHVWTSKDVPRGRSAVACGAFIEGGNSAGGGGRKGSSGSRSGSSGSSIDDVTIKPKNRATASFEAVPAEESRTLPFPGYASVVVDDVEADESVVDVDNVAESGDSFTIAVPGAPADDNLVKPDRAVGWRMQQAVHGFVRLFQESGVTEIEATWQLAMLPSAAQRLAVLDAAGQPLTALGSADQAVSLPRHGPCIVGAVRDRDCDLLLDMPTVSGRHARFEVIRLRGAGRSKCVVMDLGSTNGTWVNRAKITPFVEVPLYPGDVVCFAEPGIAFEVRTAEPAAAPKHGPAVSAALRVAQLLEAEAASRGVFAPPNAAEGAEAGAKARTLAMEGKYQAAYMLLLGGAMSHPNDAALWAQLAAMERQRARRSEQNSSEGTVRAFFRAAVERFEACEEVPVRRLGLSKVFSSWAQLEYDLRNDGPARILFQKAVRAAKSHPHGPDAASAAKLLFTWATRERKLGDDPLAARLCQEALDLEPRNTFALTLLGNIQADVGELNAARESFRRALDADPRFVSALQSWGRVEAAAGNMNGARRLFRRALRSHPTNCFVLQAWAVAEARIGQVDVARRLLEQCTMIDPGCRKAWHAWGKLEEAAGDIDRARELYQKVLKLKPKSVETLSALGHLELSAGDLAAAENALAAALEIDPRHAPSVQELAKVRRAQDRAAEAYRLEKKARRLNQDRLASISQVRSSKAPQQPGVPLN